MISEKTLIVTLLVMGTIILSFFIPPFFAALIIPVVAFGAILLGKPRLLLYLYLMAMGVYPIITTAFPHALTEYLNNMFDVALFTVFVGYLAFRKIDFSLVKKGRFGFGLLLSYAALTWLLNRGTPKGAVQAFFQYFSFIWVYILAVNFLTKRDFKTITICIILFFWFNFILNMGWLFGFNPIYNKALSLASYRGFSGVLDAMRGTFTSQIMMAYFCIML